MPPRSNECYSPPSAHRPQTELFDAKQRGFDTSLLRHVFQIDQRSDVLGVLGDAGEMNVMTGGHPGPCVDKALMNRVELVGVTRHEPSLDGLFEPGPLKYRSFKDRRRGISIIFAQFSWAARSEAKVETAIETGAVASPALGNEGPERFRNLEAL